MRGTDMLVATSADFAVLRGGRPVASGAWDDVVHAHALAADGGAPGAFMVRGSGGFAGQCAAFTGPDARARAEAYARWMNAGGAFQRRRTDPGFKGWAAPEGAGAG